AEAAAHEVEALRLAEPTQNLWTIGVAHWASSTLYLVKGDWATARALLDRGLTVTRAGSLTVTLYHTLASLACVLAQLGDTGKAFECIREAAEGFEGRAASGQVGLLGWGYYLLARASLLLDRTAEAQRLGERALEFSRLHPGFAAHAHYLFGDVAVH